MSGSGRASFLECPALEETPPLNIFRMVPRVNQTPSRSPQDLSASKSAPSSLQTERAASKQRKNSVLNSPLDLKIMDSKSSMSRSAPSFKLKQESVDDGNRAPAGQDSPESKNAMNSNWSALQSDAHFFDLDYFSSDTFKSKRATAQTAPVANALKTKVPSKQRVPSKAPSGNNASLHTSSKKAFAADNSFGSEEERSSGASVADRSMMGPPSLLDDDDTPPSIHTLRNSDFDQSGFGKSPRQSETKYSEYSSHSNVKKEESAGTLDFKKIAGTASVSQQALKSQINRVSHSPHLENMPRSDSFDPILGALSSLQQEKIKLEYRLSGTMNELSATQSELSSTKALLASLKEKSRGLLTTVRDIGADRDELRRAMDACSANIELARLGIIELRSEVNFSRRRLTEREEMNEDVSMQLQELDKELNRRSMAYQLLQSKFDEKSGLLLEERSKVSVLEERIHQLENERQALVEQHESEKSTALRSIESKLQTVNDDLTKFEGLLDTRFHDYTLRLESIHNLNLEMQDIITTNRDSISKLTSLSSSQKTHIEASLTELQELLRREISEMISQAGALQTLNANLEAENKTLQCKLTEEETASREKTTRILHLEQEISKALEELAQKVDKGVVLKLEDELSELHKAAESYSQLSAEWKEKMQQSSERIKELEDKFRSKSDTQVHKECQRLLTQQEQHAKELTMACELDKQNAIHSLTSRYDKQMAEMGRTHTASIEAIKCDLTAERELRTKTETRVSALQESVVTVTRQTEEKAAEIERLKTALEEKARRIQQLEEGRPVVNIPEIRFVPRDVWMEPVQEGRRFHSASFYDEVEGIREPEGSGNDELAAVLDDITKELEVRDSVFDDPMPLSVTLIEENVSEMQTPPVQKVRVRSAKGSAKKRKTPAKTAEASGKRTRLLRRGRHRLQGKSFEEPESASITSGDGYLCTC